MVHGFESEVRFKGALRGVRLRKWWKLVWDQWLRERAERKSEE